MTQTPSAPLPPGCLEDLAQRWEKARLSAAKPYLDRDTMSHAGAKKSQDDDILLKNIISDKKEEVLRAVFDCSRALGLGASRHYKINFENADFVSLLHLSKIPCFAAGWKTHNDALICARKGCSSQKELGSFVCDWWREALDGLVMGLGDCQRLARHRSVGHGDEECLDILFDETIRVAPMSISEKKHTVQAFGMIPAEMESALDELTARYQGRHLTLRFEGLSEGTLFYRLEGEAGALCGAGGTFTHETLKRQVGKIFPHVKLQDVGPLAVYGGQG